MFNRKVVVGVHVLFVIWIRLCSYSCKNIELTEPCFVQEIKFEPNVMCEPIDKKVTFRASQVCP
jgi:hypothetical protein